jgi:hypothetical protein
VFDGHAGASDFVYSLSASSFGHQLINTLIQAKKGLVLRLALKESLNLKVSKGPEETTGAPCYLKQDARLKYVRVFPIFLEL